MEKKLIKDQGQMNRYYKFIMFFTLGSFLGCIFETFLCYFQRGYFESRKGLIYGPFNPVYGIGVLIIIYYLENQNKTLKLFIRGAFLGGIIEYLCSWVQENFFGTTSWNYKNYPFNFDGRTSIYHMMWWGIFSILLMKIIYPLVLKIINKVSESKRLLIMYILTIFFAIDCLISGYASIRQEERLDGKEATNIIQKFFDQHYPDSLMNKVYPNKRDVVTKKKISELK